MKKLLYIVFGWCFYITFVGAEAHHGYLSSSSGDIVRDFYGSCVHTAFFDKRQGLEECHEGVQPAMKLLPVVPALKPYPTRKVLKRAEIITLSEEKQVLFYFNTAKLTPGGFNKFHELIDKFRDNNKIDKVTINGYTDALGDKAYNLKLSHARADAVRGIFQYEGIEPRKIFTQGYGDNDATWSKQCFKLYGPDNLNQISIIQARLNKYKLKKKLNKQSKLAKAKLQNQLNALNGDRQKLIRCASHDRKVVIKIDYKS